MFLLLMVEPFVGEVSNKLVWLTKCHLIGDIIQGEDTIVSKIASEENLIEESRFVLELVGNSWICALKAR